MCKTHYDKDQNYLVENKTKNKNLLTQVLKVRERIKTDYTGFNETNIMTALCQSTKAFKNKTFNPFENCSQKESYTIVK